MLAVEERALSSPNGKRKTGIIKYGPWIVAGQGYLSGRLPEDSMWARELQEHISIYHSGTGIVFGGGNSKAQPELSTYCTKGSYLCDEVDVEEVSADHMQIHLRNAGRKADLRVRIKGAERIGITATPVNSNQDACFQLPLCLLGSRREVLYRGAPLTTFGEKAFSTGLEDPITVRGEKDARPFQFEISFNQKAHAEWPVIPANVRRYQSSYGIEEGLMVLRFELSNEPVELDLRFVGDQ